MEQVTGGHERWGKVHTGEGDSTARETAHAREWGEGYEKRK